MFAAAVGVILVLLILQLTQGQTTTHTELRARLEMVEQNQREIICLLEAAERTPEVIAQCDTLPPLE